VSKVSPVTSSIATPRRITTRVALPSVTALVRRPRLVDPMAHHLKKGEGGRAAHHTAQRVIILAATRTGVITLSPGDRRLGIAAPDPHSAYAAGNDLSSMAGLTATPWWLLQNGDLS
jgi:hypothetical protein